MITHTHHESSSLADVHANSHRKEKYGDEAEEDDGVDKNGDAAGLKVAELDHSVLAGELEDEPWGQEDEQDDRNEHRPPVRHLW